MAKKMRFFSIFEKNEDMKREKIYVTAPIESTDWAIDNFLGNSFQYKINNEWYYDTSVTLPNTPELRIIGEVEKNESSKVIEIEILD